MFKYSLIFKVLHLRSRCFLNKTYGTRSTRKASGSFVSPQSIFVIETEKEGNLKFTTELTIFYLCLSMFRFVFVWSMLYYEYIYVQSKIISIRTAILT